MKSSEELKEKLSLYHIFCIETFENILHKKDVYSNNFHNPIFTYALKGGLIGQYAETYCINGQEMKFWDIDYHSKTHINLNEWGVLLASEEVIKVIEKIRIENIKKPKQKPGFPYPYYEHIEPKNETYKKLLKIQDPTKENILNAFKYCKLILITKKEADYLDSKEYKTFNSEDEKILVSWLENEYITTEIYKDSLSSIKNSKGTYVSAKANGNAYARLAHLVAHGVKFQWRCNPKNASSQGELISQYLENDKRIYSLKDN